MFIINILVPVSCSLTGTGMFSHNADMDNGTYQSEIGTTTLKVFCNDSNGFSIYAAGYTGDEVGGTDSNKLVSKINRVSAIKKLMNGAKLAQDNYNDN